MSHIGNHQRMLHRHDDVGRMRSSHRGDEMVTRDRVLSNDFLVCVKIYEYNEERKERIWFSKLVDVMKGELSQSTISKCLDRLFDLGMIDGTWESIDGRWTRTLKITGESMGFVGDLYRATRET